MRIRWIRVAFGAIVGAAAAFIVGYCLSAAFSILGFALITPSEDARPSAVRFLARSGLNFYAVHHIRIDGGGLPGGPADTFVSIAWPITMWAIVPVLALVMGGWISARLSRAAGPGSFWAGALTALPYAVILLVLRPIFAVPSVGISLPTLPVPGLEFDPGLVTARLFPAMDSTLLHGLLFGVIFGTLGASGSPTNRRRLLLLPNAFRPSWARGALISLVAGQLILLLLLALASSLGVGADSAGDDVRERGRQMRAWATILPTVSGSLYYLSHGVTLKGEYVVKPGVPEARPIVQRYRAGIITGIVADGKRESVPKWAYIAVLAPALALTLGGFLAARSAIGAYSKIGLTTGFAASYALLLTGLSTLYTLVLRTIVTTGEFSTYTVATIGPAPAQSFIFGLILAFIFGLIGVTIYRPNAHS